MDRLLDNSSLPHSTALLPPLPQPLPNPPSDCSQWFHGLITLRQTLNNSKLLSNAQSNIRSSYLGHKIKALTPSTNGSTSLPSTLGSLHERSSLIIEKSIRKVFIISNLLLA